MPCGLASLARLHLFTLSQGSMCSVRFSVLHIFTSVEFCKSRARLYTTVPTTDDFIFSFSTSFEMFLLIQSTKNEFIVSPSVVNNCAMKTNVGLGDRAQCILELRTVETNLRSGRWTPVAYRAVFRKGKVPQQSLELQPVRQQSL